tara:strand:- start:588 stop:698 length:111 start_codon:yes stop_codon:yes gene_type:complete
MEEISSEINFAPLDKKIAAKDDLAEPELPAKRIVLS